MDKKPTVGLAEEAKVGVTAVGAGLVTGGLPGEATLGWEGGLAVAEDFATEAADGTLAVV